MVTDFSQVITQWPTSRRSKETLFDQTQMQLPDNTWRDQDRVVEDTKRCECEGDDDRCCVERPMSRTS